MTSFQAARLPAIGVVLALLLFGLSTSQDKSPVEQLRCNDCHTCPRPTATEPCLNACPRAELVHQSSPHDVSMAPDTILIDEIANLYKPVSFHHKLHAEMAGMGQHCATCHHFSPPGEIQACRECHEVSPHLADLSKPTLKGAYHRQCLACHREWSHESRCGVCHPDYAGRSTALIDPTDITGQQHPVIIAPIKKVYLTSLEDLPIVTFSHRAHTDLIGLHCVDCHQNESCNSCHDTQQHPSRVKTSADPHDKCSSCHEIDDCTKCHDTKERPALDGD